MVYHLKPEDAKKCHLKAESLMKERLHILKYGEYEKYTNSKFEKFEKHTIRNERDAVLHVICIQHHPEKIIETTYHNYNRSKTGLKCCGNSSKGNKLKGRVFSKETIRKMSNSAKFFQATRPRAKDLRDSIEYDDWRKKAQMLGSYKCSIIGDHPEKLVVHHLFSMKSFESIRYDFQNSLTLSDTFHKNFHDKYGYDPNIPQQFLKFLEILISDKSFRDNLFQKIIVRKSSKNKKKELISSQTLQECDEGSETRLYDPKRIMKLHERVTKLSEQLYKKLYEKEKILVKQLCDILMI
uniref:Putative HNH homing endonuclease n=1 Tax=Jenufa perforata TaxID=993091 RepID=A0A0S2LNJ5_9CHLO|nr:putative HNH homing endonuclease [Jenufa perforata]ALO62926.1 putative HNH homing endonuclease [Jenufa perforata]